MNRQNRRVLLTALMILAFMQTPPIRVFAADIIIRREPGGKRLLIVEARL